MLLIMFNFLYCLVTYYRSTEVYKFAQQSPTVYLKTDGTTGQDGASLPQLAAISRRGGRRVDRTGNDGTSNMYSHTI